MLIRPRRILRGMPALAATRGGSARVAAPHVTLPTSPPQRTRRPPPPTLHSLRLLRRLLLRVPLLVLALAGAAGISRPGWAAELRVVLEAAPVTLDPLLASDASGVRISHQLLCETLLTLGESLSIEPGLALRWERLAPTRYRFHLRPGVRFASGAPLDARDAVATLERVLDPATGSPYGAPLREKVQALRLVSAGAHPPLAFDVELKRPYASILSDLVLPVLSRAPLAGRAPDALLPFDCSGPYRLASRSPAEIVLERSDTFHGRQPPLQRIVFKIVQDENTRLLKFYKGDLDLGINALPVDKLDLFAKRPLADRYRVVEGPGLSFEYLGFNLEDRLLADRRVRQAIAHAVNVADLIRYRQRGHAVRAVSLLPPGSPDAWPGTPPAYDPALAERLLDEAGHPRSFGTRFTLVYKTSTERAALARARIVQADLRRVGIAVDIRSFEWATFFDDIQKGNFELYALRWIGVSDPAFLAEVLLSDRMPPQGRNRGRYRNPAMDRLLQAALVEPDEVKRRELYRQADKLAQEDLPYLPLWHNNTVAIVSKRFAGFRLHPTGGFQSLPFMHAAP
jgi:peptide/nickel transport system substrate-binding protein